MGADDEQLLTHPLDVIQAIKTTRLEERVKALDELKANTIDIVRLKEVLSREIVDSDAATRGVLLDKINSLNSRVIGNNTQAAEAIKKVEDLASRVDGDFGLIDRRISAMEASLAEMASTFKQNAEESKLDRAETLAILNQIRSGSPQAMWQKAWAIAKPIGGAIVFLVILFSQGASGIGAAWTALRTSFGG